jgi:hypothetical protein
MTALTYTPLIDRAVANATNPDRAGTAFISEIQRLAYEVQESRVRIPALEDQPNIATTEALKEARRG